ncbi:MAG TPA: glycosyltransferase family A protein [Stellaceae bacterium]|nr:glycosyltransferase family A protein [Stellaceae bacterium]
MIAASPPAAAEPLVSPLVSVVVPVYNRAHLVGRAIASVLAQTYRNIEIIVVDDASTDALAAALAQTPHPRLRRVVHPRNRGAAAARNTGVAAAAGDYVAFLDSDDVWYPRKLAVQVAAMQGQPLEVAGTVCAYACVKPGYPARNITPDWTAGTFFHRQLLGCTCGPGTTLLCRRAVFAAIGPYDEELRRLEDWDWLLRLAEAGRRLLSSSEVLAWVEVGPGGSRHAVEAALRRIGERHGPTIAAQGAAARRCFEATLRLEAAAAAFGAKAYGPALAHTLRSLALYPARGAEFYRNLLRRAGRAVRPRRLPQSPPATSSL